jgi:hypothetical protein
MSLSFQGALTNTSTYQWMIPLLKNPTINYATVSYNLTLYRYTGKAEPIIISFYEIIN